MTNAEAGPSFQINREQERLKIISCFLDHFSPWVKFWGLAFISRKPCFGWKTFLFGFGCLGLHKVGCLPPVAIRRDRWSRVGTGSYISSCSTNGCEKQINGERQYADKLARTKYKCDACLDKSYNHESILFPVAWMYKVLKMFQTLVLVIDIICK